MKPERWQQVREVLHEAMQMDEEEQSAFLDSQCATDPSLRAELNELLAAEGEIGSSFLEKPAFAHAVFHTDSSDHGTVLPTGTKLGPYVVQSLIGAGGMGEVYRARDASLKRDVAIKVLAASLSRDPDRLRRFQLEAEAAAALNHPNILSIYAIGQQDGSPYIVTELLEGETLRERLRQGAMRLRDAIDIAIAVAKGLAAAHEKGIAHRDLKPENIYLAKDGRVKILDFGLAKLMQNPSGSDGSTVSLRDQTDAGRVLGTVGYMSPEQVRGQAADARSDIFALGCVFYEMLTGKRAFRKPSSVETMNAILKEDPQAASEITRKIPPALQRVVHRCLEKVPDRRFQSASDLAFALDALSDSAVSPSARVRTVAGKPAIARKSLARGLGLFVVLAVITLAYLRMRPEAAPRVSNYVRLTHDGQRKGLIGTDGSRLYLLMTTRDYSGIAEMSVSGGEPQKMPNLLPLNMTILSLSPDGSKLLEVERQGNGNYGPLFSLPVLGGSLRRLAEIEGESGTWSPDGKRLAYTKRGKLFVANADGGDSHKILDLKDRDFVYAPVWSPDGLRLRFLLQQGIDVPSGRYWEVSLDGTGLHQLFPGWTKPPDSECCGSWTADGRYFLFLVHDQVWAVPRERHWFGAPLNPIQLTSSPTPLGDPVPGTDGKRLFVVGHSQLGELVQYDSKSGKFLPFLGGISAEYVAFSKDSNWVAYTSYPEGTLWRSRLDGSERLQLSYPPVYAMLPRWSPDGNQIVFFEGANGKPHKLYLVSPRGGSPRQLLPDDSIPQADPTWAPDGTKIVFGGISDDVNSVITVLDVASHQLSTLPASKGLFSPRWSPDGRYIAALPGDSSKILLFDMSSQKWSELAEGSLGWEEWSKDNQYIYFFDFRGTGAISRVRLSDHKVERIADLRTLAPTGYEGSWFANTPDDVPMLLRDIGTQDIYSLDWEAP